MLIQLVYVLVNFECEPGSDNYDNLGDLNEISADTDSWDSDEDL